MHKKLLHAMGVDPRLSHMNKHLHHMFSSLSHKPRRLHEHFKHLQISPEFHKDIEGEGVKHSHYKAHRPRKLTPLKMKW